MARDAYAIPNRKVVIFWSRKSGNTSLADWVADVVSPGGRRNTPSRRFLKRNGYIIHFEEALRLVQNEGYADFVLVRNPFRRIVSSYVEKFIYYAERPMDQLANLKRFSQHAFLDIMAAQGKPASPRDYSDNYEGVSFVEFLEFIRDRVRNPTDDGEPELNGHWNTQVPFSFSTGFTYSNIIRLERVGTDILPLAKALGTELAFPHTRSNEVNAKLVKDRDLSGTRSVAMIREEIVPAPEALLNDQTCALIREAYEIDFRKLGYDPNEGGQG